jgi:putative ABC transport system ATP-binding protein
MLGEVTLEGRNLMRTFGDGEEEAKAVDDVSLQLHRAEVTLLMGPSGSGKSTLLALLAGLLHPTSGSVLALHRDLWQMGEQERHKFRLDHFGFIFQGFNLFPALTAMQNLEMVLRLGQDVPAREAHERSEKMLKLLDLGKKGKLRPAQLSGGEKQRVAVARALVKQPTFCFADEPTAALDWLHGKQVVELLCSAARHQGTTLLIVSHDNRLLSFVDRVYYLEDGRLRNTDNKVGELIQAGGGH